MAGTNGQGWKDNVKKDPDGPAFSIIKKTVPLAGLAAAVLLLAIPFQFLVRLDGTDWLPVFYPVSRAVLGGGSAYSVPGFFNPPWLIPIILPLSIGSPAYSQSLMFIVSLLSAVILCRRMGAGPLASAAYLLSAPSLITLTMGNFEHILMLGLLLPVEWGVLVLLVKPQIGIGYILYHAITGFREAGWRGLLRLVSPLTAGVMTASLMVFGYASGNPGVLPWNLPLFPYFVPAGLVALFLAVKKHRPEASLAASPAFSPYVTLNSFLTAGVGLMKLPARWMVLYFILSWVVQVVFWMGHL